MLVDHLQCIHHGARRGGDGDSHEVIDGQKVAVVLPAYNAARTLRQTVAEIPRDVVDDVILTDDCS